MLSIRKVEEKDIKTLFDWANHPTTRENSLNTNPIPWGEHQAWFNKKISDPNAILYIISNADDLPVSSVRFEKKDRWIIGIVVSPDMQGKGIGKEALRVAIADFFKHKDGPVYASIKRSNLGSINIFKHNLFQKIEDGEIQIYKRDF